MADEPRGHKEQPIIIKKIKKVSGHGHHGGAWKVAYADFVTAMMAFFIVMWILASSEEVKENVSEYFNNPSEFDIFTGEKKTGPVPIEIDLGLKQLKNGEGEGKSGKESFIKFDSETTDSLMSRLLHKAVNDSILARQRVEQIGKEIERKLKELVANRPELEKILSSIKIEMTIEGLRIELIETSESLFFEVGSARLSREAINILSQLAGEIGKLPNYVEIEGHTDSRGYKNKADYSNWELSADRSNSARRVLERNGFWEGQVVKVTGFADQKLRNPENPFDVVNRRVSILIKQMSANQFLPDVQAIK